MFRYSNDRLPAEMGSAMKLIIPTLLIRVPVIERKKGTDGQDRVGHGPVHLHMPREADGRDPACPTNALEEISNG